MRRIVRLAIGATASSKPRCFGTASRSGKDRPCTPVRRSLAQVIARLASDGAPLSGQAPGSRGAASASSPVADARRSAASPAPSPWRYGVASAQPILPAERQAAPHRRVPGFPGRKGKPPTARAAAVEEPWSEAAIEACRALGLEVEAIHPAGGRIEAGLDLMPEGERSVRDRRARIAIRRWAIVAAVWPGWFSAESRSPGSYVKERRVRSRLEALAEPAAAMGRARGVVARAGSATLAAVSISESDTARSAATVLRGCRGPLPDSSHLTRRWNWTWPGRGSMTGVARRTADVIDALDAGGGDRRSKAGGQ